MASESDSNTAAPRKLAEIRAVACNMDSEALNRLLQQDHFREVNSNEDQKKEGNLDGNESKPRDADNTTAQCGKSDVGHYLGNGSEPHVSADKESTGQATLVLAIQDILMRILFRLPADKLLELHRVSKDWSRTLKNKLFLSSYGLEGRPLLLSFSGDKDFHRMQPQSYVYQYYEGVSSFVLDKVRSFVPSEEILRRFKALSFIGRYVPPGHDLRCFRALSSNNGLVLFSFLWNGCVARENLLVCNPGLGIYHLLPRAPLIGDETAASFGLSYERTGNGDYKVICIWTSGCPIYEEDIPTYGWVLYQSEDSSWTRGPEIVKEIYVWLFRGGVYWKNHMHFLNILEGPNDKSLRFSMTRHTIQSMPALPPSEYKNEYQLDEHRRRFVVSGNHFYLWEGFTSSHNVFELKVDYSGWNLVYKLPVVDIKRVLNDSYLVLIGLVRGTNTLWMIYHRSAREVVAFNPRTSAIQRLISSHELRDWEMFEFVDSLKTSL